LYHPLFLFNGHGDCLAAKLRSGKVHSAEDWDELLLPEIERQHATGTRGAFRGDAAFAKPEIYQRLEERDVEYAIRIPTNKTLGLEIEDILFGTPGRPSRKHVVRSKSVRYQADSWTTPRRVVPKVEHHAGELFPRVVHVVHRDEPRCRVAPSCASTAREAPPSSGSRKASKPRIGHDYPVIGFGPTKCASS
jgi:hypothetical protein